MPPKKRVQLTRIGPARNEDSFQQSTGLEPSVEKKSAEAGPQVRSIRLDIPLGESNKEKYPYVDYMAEVKKEVARIKLQLEGQKEVQVLNVYDSSTEEEVEDVDSPTRKRAKGGTSRGKKNKRTRLREGDFHHVASGYDESDDFIDNSVHLYEVDEVPPDVSPPRGGFYINKGKIKSEEENPAEETKKSSKIAEQTKSEKENSVKETKKKTSKTAEQIKPKKEKNSVKEMSKKKTSKTAERIKSKKEQISVKEKKKTAKQTKSEKEENSVEKTKKKTSKTAEQIKPGNEENSVKKTKNKTSKTTKRVKSEKENSSAKEAKKKTLQAAEPMEK